MRESLCPAGTMRAALSIGMPGARNATSLVVATGRVAELTKKILRDDTGAAARADAAESVTLSKERRFEVASATVTVMRAWLAAHTFHLLDPAETLAASAAKLADRKERSVLSGSGDHR